MKIALIPAAAIVATLVAFSLPAFAAKDVPVVVKPTRLCGCRGV